MHRKIACVHWSNRAVWLSQPLTLLHNSPPRIKTLRNRGRLRARTAPFTPVTDRNAGYSEGCGAGWTQSKHRQGLGRLLQLSGFRHSDKWDRATAKSGSLGEWVRWTEIQERYQLYLVSPGGLSSASTFTGSDVVVLGRQLICRTKLWNLFSPRSNMISVYGTYGSGAVVGLPPPTWSPQISGWVVWERASNIYTDYSVAPSSTTSFCFFC